MECDHLKPSSSAESIGSNISSQLCFVAFKLEDEDYDFETKKCKGGKRELYGNNCPIIPDKDICDCTREKCPGCWSECIKCGSTKCGLECRINRKKSCKSIAFAD
uniref:ARF7EP_C domain-containing protein n=1 Tax=Glossina pallidipes TaxID=7398 RepID=A0A1A9Z8C9_GLOPL